MTNDDDMDYTITWYEEQSFYDYTITHVLVEGSFNGRHWDALVHFELNGDLTEKLDQYFLEGRNFEESHEFIHEISKSRYYVHPLSHTAKFGNISRCGPSKILV